MKLKSYHSDFHKFITKKMNKINSMFPLDEQLEPFELHQLINMYIDIRIIIHSVTGRKNNFIIHFFISRLLQFIDKHNLVKYVDCSLSKLTYNKYCTQWLSICNHINQKFNMDNIHIKQYPSKSTSDKSGTPRYDLKYMKQSHCFINFLKFGLISCW